MKFDTQNRRQFGRRVLIEALGGWGLARRLLAAEEKLEFHALKKPLTVALNAVAEPWKPYPFRAIAPRLGPGGEPGSHLLLPGNLLRVAGPGSSDSGLRAFCLSCPHELCDVKLAEDAGLPDGAAPPPPRGHPMFVCPCHFSVFDPVADGKRLTGPAGRALYRFRIRVSATEVEIDAVEEDALR